MYGRTPLPSCSFNLDQTQTLTVEALESDLVLKFCHDIICARIQPLRLTISPLEPPELRPTEPSQTSRKEEKRIDYFTRLYCATGLKYVSIPIINDTIHSTLALKLYSFLRTTCPCSVFVDRSLLVPVSTSVAQNNPNSPNMRGQSQKQVATRRCCSCLLSQAAILIASPSQYC